MDEDDRGSLGGFLAWEYLICTGRVEEGGVDVGYLEGESRFESWEGILCGRVSGT